MPITPHLVRSVLEQWKHSEGCETFLRFLSMDIRLSIDHFMMSKSKMSHMWERNTQIEANEQAKRNTLTHLLIVLATQDPRDQYFLLSKRHRLDIVVPDALQHARENWH